MSVSSETATARTLFMHVDELEDIAHTFPESDERRARLDCIAYDQLREAPPLRPVIAAELLDLSEKTVRNWANEGVLTVEESHTRLLLETKRVHEVYQVVRDLRAAGVNRGLLDEVYRRLVDQSWLERDDLRQSLQELKNNEGVLRRASPEH